MSKSYWTKREQNRFLMGVDLCLQNAPQNEWKFIQSIVGTKTYLQVKHYGEQFLREEKHNWAPWTEEERDILVKNYGRHSLVTIARKLPKRSLIDIHRYIEYDLFKLHDNCNCSSMFCTHPVDGTIINENDIDEMIDRIMELKR
jgi:hypothetical protein